MRGVVTLAVAFALPSPAHGDAPFPFRELIVFVAFGVVVGTLVVQGLTLGPLMRLLRLSDNDPVGREVAFARREAYRAAIATTDGNTSPLGQALRKEDTAMLTAADADPDGRGPASLPGDDLRRNAISAARTALLDLRRAGHIGDPAFHRVEEDLDFAEMTARERE